MLFAKHAQEDMLCTPDSGDSIVALPMSPPAQLVHNYHAAPRQLCSWADPAQLLTTANTPTEQQLFPLC